MMPTDVASVSSFKLDKYLVTVGRFRKFVNAWNGGAGWTPQAGAGKHAHLNGGKGLNGIVFVNAANAPGNESGWVVSDDVNIAPTNANLACDASFAPWTASVGSQENLPIGCVTWYEAYAFCIWDGGFLPSEAEWEFASAGGSQQRDFPWGSTVPGTACPGTGCQYTIYNCDYPSGAGSCSDVSNIAPVGTATLGAGLWGQLDLAGNVWEWNLDWHSGSYLDPCTDCADLTVATLRELRGGYFGSLASDLFPGKRNSGTPTDRFSGNGVRCARIP
jgi:formylglycine-generating enzyme required for sulfatase activity